MNDNHKYYAYYFIIPCYFYTDDNTLIGRNWFFDLLVRLFISIENFAHLLGTSFIIDYNASFKIWIGEKVLKEKK